MISLQQGIPNKRSLKWKYSWFSVSVLVLFTLFNFSPRVGSLYIADLTNIEDRLDSPNSFNNDNAIQNDDGLENPLAPSYDRKNSDLDDAVNIGAPREVIRETRNAIKNGRRGNHDDFRHVRRIPVSNAQKSTHLHGTSPPPDEDEEDAFESLEGNREAFLEILKEHAEMPRRRRSFKRHSSILLKFDSETNRYTITEPQSDEWN